MFVLRVYIFLSFFSSSWCRELAAVCDCGIPWTFLLTFLQVFILFSNYMRPSQGFWGNAGIKGTKEFIPGEQMFKIWGTLKQRQLFGKETKGNPDFNFGDQKHNGV